MTQVALRNVSCAYGSFVAVQDLSLDIASGEFLTLLGPSGCGKSTTLRMIAGLVRNTGGQIEIGSTLVSDAASGLFLPPEARRLGMVFQSYAIWPHMTVFQNVAYPLKIRRTPKPIIREKVTAALKLVEMDHLADRPAPDLSGGQQQRVAIARALVFEPAVLLLDEPLSNLDSRLRLQMGDEFRALQQRLGITTIYVTHDQGEAMALSDRVVLMSSGAVLQNATRRDIFLKPKSRKVAEFFGSPNFIDVTVDEVGTHPDGAYEVKVSGNGATGICLADFRPERGSQLTMMVRPESFVLLTQNEESEGLTWMGTVQRATFRGATQSIVVKTEAGPIHVEIGNFPPVEPGAPIRVGAPLSTAWVLP